MGIKKLQEGSRLEVALVGRLDTKASPDLEAALGDLEGIEELLSVGFYARSARYVESVSSYRMA